MAAKGLDTGDRVLAYAMAQRMIHALRQQERRGQLQDGGKVKGASGQNLTLGTRTGMSRKGGKRTFGEAMGGWLLDQAGTKPRTTRNIMGNDRGPSGRPARYPSRTCL
jgi:hypothetical protein